MLLRSEWRTHQPVATLRNRPVPAVPVHARRREPGPGQGCGQVRAQGQGQARAQTPPVPSQRMPGSGPGQARARLWLRPTVRAAASSACKQPRVRVRPGLAARVHRPAPAVPAAQRRIRSGQGWSTIAVRAVVPACSAGKRSDQRRDETADRRKHQVYRAITERHYGAAYCWHNTAVYHGASIVRFTFSDKT
jgi:hypothetical protein